MMSLETPTPVTLRKLMKRSIKGASHKHLNHIQLFMHPAVLTMAKKPLPAGFEKPNKDDLLQLIKIYSSLHTESIPPTASSSSEDDIDALPPPEVVKRIEALMEKIASSAEKIDFTMPEHLKSWCAYKKTGLVGEDADRFLLERMKNKDNEPSELNNDNKDGNKQVVLGVLDAIIELLEEKNKIFGFLQLFYWCHHLFENKDEPYLAVEYICSVLGCAQSTLNIHDSDYGAGPAAGRVSGLLSFKTDGIEKLCSNTNRTTFPRSTSKVTDMKNHGALFVLLVQSVDVLNDLIKRNFCNDYPCILIAGRKYPTAAVISFSKRVSEELKLPLFCFLDWDPLSWKLLLGCGGAGPNQLPSYTKWLGIRPSDISELDLPDCEMNDDEFDYLKTIDEYLMKQEPQVKRTKVETIALCAHGFEVFVPCRLKQIIEKEIEKFNHMSSKFLIMREQAAIAKFNHMAISPQ